jgi:hypothetical protein
MLFYPNLIPRDAAYALQPSKPIGSLFVVSGLLGIVILALDQVLRSGAPSHYFALIAFVIIDFLLGGLAFPMPKSLLVRLAALWATFRILIQLGDVFLGPMYQFKYAQFADYLFNPLSSLPASLGNPAGIPPVPIDLILIIDIAVLLIAARTRSNK